MNREAAQTGSKQDANTGYIENGLHVSGLVVPVAVKAQRQFTAWKADLISLVSAEDTRKSEDLIDGFLKAGTTIHRRNRQRLLKV